MLDKGKYERMIDQPTVDDCLSILYEAGYPEGSDYEKVLQLESVALYDYIREIVPDKSIFDLFMLRHDAHNLKVLLKDEFTGKDSSHLLLANGIYDILTLQVMLRDRNFIDLPKPLATAMVLAIEGYNKTKNPQIIDVYLDKASYTVMSTMSKESKQPFVIKLLSMQIDLANIKSFIRIKSKMEDLELLSKVLLDGGTIPLKTFGIFFQDEMTVFAEYLTKTIYSDIVDNSFTDYFNITSLEKTCDDFLMAFLRVNKRKAFGIEPVIGYLLGKETELQNARIILVGKTNDIDSDIIRERLRVSYV